MQGRVPRAFLGVGGGTRPTQGKETTEMVNLVKIGHMFLNLDRVWCFEDRFVNDRVDEVVARFGSPGGETYAFNGREADDLRTWLNSQAVNLRAVTSTDLPTEGRSM